MHVQQFTHDGWQIKTFLGWDLGSRCLEGGAELSYEGLLRCRITLPPGFQDHEEAHESLSGRAQGFIADWYAREHSAVSEFSEL